VDGTNDIQETLMGAAGERILGVAGLEEVEVLEAVEAVEAVAEVEEVESWFGRNKNAWRARGK
jgi:hypothetical protein